jgi:hypothetical protein
MSTTARIKRKLTYIRDRLSTIRDSLSPENTATSLNVPFLDDVCGAVFDLMEVIRLAVDYQTSHGNDVKVYLDWVQHCEDMLDTIDLIPDVVAIEPDALQVDNVVDVD